MDLLNVFSGSSPALCGGACDATPVTSASADTSGGSENPTFLATLTALLGPLASSGGDDELAAAGEGSHDGDGDPLDEVMANIWPMAALVSTTVAVSDEEVAATTAVADETDTAEVEVATATSDLASGDAVSAASTEVPAEDTADEVDEPGSGSGASPSGHPTEGEAGVDGPVTTAQPSTGSTGSAAGFDDPSLTGRDAAARGAARAGNASEAARPEVPVVARDAAPPSAERSSAEDRPVHRADPTVEPARPSAASMDAATPAPSSTGAQADRVAGMGDGIRRVLEAIELLENAPPPRQITIEVAEGRLRVGIEDGQVRLSAVESASDDLEELIRAAEEALAEHGFDLERDGRGQDDRADDHAHDPSTTPTRSRAARAAATGLRL